ADLFLHIQPQLFAWQGAGRGDERGRGPVRKEQRCRRRGDGAGAGWAGKGQRHRYAHCRGSRPSAGWRGFCPHSCCGPAGTAPARRAGKRQLNDSAGRADIAALAKGGRTNFIGFLLRLAARVPFLFIAGRLYGAASLGRFASALVVVELLALICSMGEKRGLAQRLSEGEGIRPANLVFDSMLLAVLLATVAAVFLWFVPAPMFPAGQYSTLDKLLVTAIPAYALTEILLAAQAYRYDIATTVRARAIVEPWTISIMAGVCFYLIPKSGLSLAYIASIYAGMFAAAWPFFRTYGLPRQ